LRILHIDSEREMRGGQWQALYLMQGLAALGYEQELLAPAGSALLDAAAARRLSAGPMSVSAVARNARRFDIVHAHTARAHAVAAPFAGGRLVVARRVAFPLRRSAVSRWKYGRAAHYIAVSQFVRDALMQGGVPAEKVTVVYDGVPLPAAWTSGGGGRLTLALDSADPLKGRDVVERAGAIAGVRVQFSQDLPADLADAGLFVYITESEGLGSAALLASAHGVPVVASRVGGLPEAVEDGVTGLLTTGDPAEVAAAMLRILNDRTLAAQMGVAGRARVEQHFTIEAMVRGTAAVYEKVHACSKH
jgi:glycosyltransferase involved in cell wall biosynthesis